MNDFRHLLVRRKLPKVAGKKFLRRWLRHLRELRARADFTNACFDPFVEGHPTTKMVNSLTKNYRATWIIPQIDGLIYEMQAILDGKEPDK